MKKQKKDVIIIGAGVGGLTCGAILSKEFNVSIFEKSDWLGGRCSSRVINGCKLDIGAIMLGGRLQKSMSAINANINFKKVKFNIFSQNPITFPTGIHSIQELNKLGIGGQHTMKFFLKTILHQKTNYLKKSSSYKTLINELTENSKLRNLLYSFSLLWGQYPEKLSIEHFRLTFLGDIYKFNSPIYPMGGTGQISNSIANVITKNGSRTYTNKEVKEIIIENNSAIGVKLNDGTEILSDNVVSNIGWKETVGLINKDSLKKMNMIPDNQNSHNISSDTIFFALNTNKPVLKKNYLLTYKISSDIENELLSIQKGKIIEDNTFALEIPTNIDKTLAPKGTQAGSIFIPVGKNENIRILQKKRKIVLEEINSMFPNFNENLLWTRSMEPQDYQNQIGISTIFRNEETQQIIKPDQVTEIQNLFLVGDSTKPIVSSVTQAIHSGEIAAKTLLKR